MDLNDDSRQWDYTDAAQRILIAERCRAMLDALASNTPAWDDVTPDATRENLALEFAHLTNAKGSVESALRRMRAPASPEPAPTFRRGIYIGDQPASTATAAQSITRDTPMKMCPKCGGLGNDPLVYPVDNEAMALAQAPECKMCDGSGEVPDEK